MSEFKVTNAPAVGDRTAAALEALKSGKSGLEAADSQDTTSEVTGDTAGQDWNDFLYGDNTGVEEVEEASETNAESNEQELSENTESPDSDLLSEVTAEPIVSDIEELTVTGATGRRKVKVDFSDRDMLKKHIALSYGARKWQKERDEARTKLEEVTKEFSGLSEDWNKVEKAYQDRGVEGLVDLLEGEEGAYSKFIKQEISRIQNFENMSDSEKDVWQAKREIDKQTRDNKRLQADYEKKLAEINAAQERTTKQQLEASLHPAFDRNRFKGRLGNEVAEHRLDKAIWTEAMAELEALPENVEITPAIASKIFRKVKKDLDAVLAEQSDRKVKSAMDRTKKSAASKARATVTKGLSGSQQVEAFKSDMRKGDLVSGIKSFFAAGGKFE